MPVKTRRELGGGKAEVTFATTPRMSSYLLFFGLGDLERAAMMAGKTEVGVVTGKGNVKKAQRSEEHTSELQSLMRISYAVFCLKKKTKQHEHVLREQSNVTISRY